MIALVLGCAGMLAVVILADRFAMRYVGNKELRRKLIHVVAGLATIALTNYYSLDQIAFMALGMLGVMLVARYRNELPSLRGISRRSYGDVFYALGVGIAALFAPDIPTFIGLMLVVTISDTLASLVGQRWAVRSAGRYTKKSGIGSAAFFFSAVLCLIMVIPALGYYALFVAAALMVVEYVSPIGLDNATIPLVGVLVIGLVS